MTAQNVSQDLHSLQHSIYRQVRSQSHAIEQTIPWLVDPRNLASAWDRVRTSNGASTPGVDHVTAASVAARSDA